MPYAILLCLIFLFPRLKHVRVNIKSYAADENHNLNEERGKKKIQFISVDSNFPKSNGNFIIEGHRWVLIKTHPSKLLVCSLNMCLCIKMISLLDFGPCVNAELITNC